jgi:aromatic ring-opening dioxygenase LigB subunit
MMESMSSPGITDIVYLPHGTMTLDPSLPDLPEGAADLHHRCMSIGKKAALKQHDHVVLLAPHGIHIDGAVGVYNPGSPLTLGTGNGLWCGGWGEFEVEAELDGELSADIYTHLQTTTDKDMPPVVAVRTYGGISAPLRWSEVVPLFFLLQNRKGASVTRRGKRVETKIAQSSLTILTVPRIMFGSREERVRFRAHQEAANAAVGRALDVWAKQTGKRVLLLVSGDQSHVHEPPSGVNDRKYLPDPTSHFISNAALAAKFDGAWNEWVNALANDKAYAQGLVHRALQVDDQAMCCGLSGMLTINGLVQASQSSWALVEHGYRCPSYYGMMAFMITRQ